MTVYLKDILPVDLLNTHLENGVIRKQFHPEHPELYILNYTEQAQFERIWDAATNVCRGLIAADDVVIARGFNKFHNLNTEYVPETMEENLPKDFPPLVTTKLDGSMGIVYFYAGQWSVATRGSFASDQALWATKWLRTNYPLGFTDPLATPVTEIIYPENRIVVDYGWEGLVLLSMIENATGRELGRLFSEAWAFAHKFKIVPKFDKSLAECASEDNPNEEGYVLTYSNGVKVKVKFVEYVRLHRILTGLNPKAIWELLAKKPGTAVDLLLADEKMPESFKTWLSGWTTQLRARYSEIERQARAVFEKRPKPNDDLGPAPQRKTVALYFQQTRHLCSVLFAMLDGKDHSEVIWNMVKPKATDTFKNEGE